MILGETNIVSVSDAVWQKWVAAFSVQAGKSFREALYEEWPLLMRKVMDFTPPFKTKGAPGSSDLSIGRAAVAFDIYKTMRPFNPAARTRALEKIITEKDITAFNIMALRSKDPRLKGVTAIDFAPQVHLSQRDSRGRVTGRDRRKVVLGSDVGLLKGYVTREQNQVGFAKSGWLKALLLVGGDAPGYVTRHGTGGGDVIDEHANEEDPSITAINRTPWAGRKDEGARILSDAKASRIAAIQTKIQVAIRLADRAAKSLAAA